MCWTSWWPEKVFGFEGQDWRKEVVFLVFDRSTKSMAEDFGWSLDMCNAHWLQLQMCFLARAHQGSLEGAEPSSLLANFQFSMGYQHPLGQMKRTIS